MISRLERGNPLTEIRTFLRLDFHCIPDASGTLGDRGWVYPIGSTRRRAGEFTFLIVCGDCGFADSFVVVAVLFAPLAGRDVPAGQKLKHHSWRAGPGPSGLFILC